jgi:hypothetical protein
MDALFKVEVSKDLDRKAKRNIAAKMKAVAEAIQDIETTSGLKYPPYYVEVLLTVVPENPASVDLGILYARTIPVETQGRVIIFVQLSAALLLYATKRTIRLVLAHEFLHYIDLIREFSRIDVSSQTASNSVFEEEFVDTSRALDPGKVFNDKVLVRSLRKKTASGLLDPKLNEKCKTKWIEKGLPMQKLSLARNVTHISIETILRSRFDPKVLELLRRIDATGSAK